jgi:hypothetical protein
VELFIQKKTSVNEIKTEKGDIMRAEISLKLMFIILIGLLVIIQPPNLLAQRKERKVRRVRHSAVLVNPPAERTRVVVGSKEFHYAHGVFYRVGPKGFIAMRGPIGARVRTLPTGYISLEIGGAPFFFYYGTYYQFDQPAKEYVVVSPPPGAPTVPGLDKIDLVTGETINGTYLGGTQSAVQVDVGGKVREIPVEQIISIVFAPAEQ